MTLFNDPVHPVTVYDDSSLWPRVMALYDGPMWCPCLMALCDGLELCFSACLCLCHSVSACLGCFAAHSLISNSLCFCLYPLSSVFAPTLHSLCSCELAVSLATLSFCTLYDFLPTLCLCAHDVSLPTLLLSLPTLIGVCAHSASARTVASSRFLQNIHLDPWIFIFLWIPLSWKKWNLTNQQRKIFQAA